MLFLFFISSRNIANRPLPPQEVEAICTEVTAQGHAQSLVVQPANFNSPEQTVISGSVEAIEPAMKLAKDRGAKIAKKLAVGGAFHSPLMAAAREGLQKGLAAVTFHDAKFPVYTNVTGTPEMKAERLRELLEQQLTSPVRWLSTIENMIAGGAQSFWEIGPGNVLAGILKRINKSFAATTMGKVEEVQAALG
jgi:[acyl-carrier-protein] S-malonyltransferase